MHKRWKDSERERSSIYEELLQWRIEMSENWFDHHPQVAQPVKNPPAMQKTWVQCLGWEDPLEKGMANHSVFWPGEFHGLYSPWDRKQLDMTEPLSFSQPVARDRYRSIYSGDRSSRVMQTSKRGLQHQAFQMYYEIHARYSLWMKFWLEQVNSSKN